MDFAEIPPVLDSTADSLQTVVTPRHDATAVVEIGDGVSPQQLQAYYTDAQRNQLVTEMQTALSKNQFDADDRSALSVGEHAVKITADAIQEGRRQWRAATSWCCSLFPSNPQETATEAALAENLLPQRV